MSQTGQEKLKEFPEAVSLGTVISLGIPNVMLHGVNDDLNGSTLRCALALSDAELAATPPPYADAYRAAQKAAEAGDRERVQEIADTLRIQQCLFDLDAFNTRTPSPKPRRARPKSTTTAAATLSLFAEEITP